MTSCWLEVCSSSGGCFVLRDGYFLFWKLWLLGYGGDLRPLVYRKLFFVGGIRFFNVSLKFS